MLYAATLVAHKRLQLVAGGYCERQLRLVHLHPCLGRYGEGSRLLEVGIGGSVGCAVNLVDLISDVGRYGDVRALGGSTVIAELHIAVLARRRLHVDEEEAHAVVHHRLSHAATLAANEGSHLVAVGGKRFEHRRETHYGSHAHRIDTLVGVAPQRRLIVAAEVGSPHRGGSRSGRRHLPCWSLAYEVLLNHAPLGSGLLRISLVALFGALCEEEAQCGEKRILYIFHIVFLFKILLLDSLHRVNVAVYGDADDIHTSRNRVAGVPCDVYIAACVAVVPCHDTLAAHVADVYICIGVAVDSGTYLQLRVERRRIDVESALGAEEADAHRLAEGAHIAVGSIAYSARCLGYDVAVALYSDVNSLGLVATDGEHEDGSAVGQSYSLGIAARLACYVAHKAVALLQLYALHFYNSRHVG